jgi:hypothetical protein
VETDFPYPQEKPSGQGFQSLHSPCEIHPYSRA